MGGARTALFNFLFAKHHEGEFYLRIEDTDRERSKQEYTDQICESLHWLGLTWDGKIIYQSNRGKKYREAIQSLLESDHAYRCYCTKEDLEKSRREGNFQYPKTCRHLHDDTVKKNVITGKPFVIRIKIPEGKTRFQDMIYGNISVNNTEIDDFIIARSDGSPTYNLVVVVDDDDMDISHVIRGEDHISNTTKQIQLYQALGYQCPVFAHLPMILGPDKKRLSKRHGAPGVQQFKRDGYLPDAVLNYLALLGWSPETEQEIFNLKEMISEFDLPQVNKKAAVYDEKKLHWVSGQHIQKLENDKILEGIRSIDPHWGNGSDLSFLKEVINLLKLRAKSMVEFIEQSDYFFNDPTEYDEKSARKNWSNESVNGIILSFKNKCESLESWSPDMIENELRAMATRNEMSAGKIIHPVRLAISGVPHGPSLFHMMGLLGRDTCVRRLNHALTQLPIP